MTNKKALFSLILIASLVFVSCNTNKKNEKSESKTKNNEKLYFLDTQTTSVGWVAYKTTDKVAVKGEFKKYTVENNNGANTMSAALNGIKFSIPVNSLSTNDTIRDEKLKKFFFGTLNDTENINGTIRVENDQSAIAELTFNGVTANLPLTINSVNETIKLEGLMMLNTWQAQVALKSINLACFDLHKGPDGVSKTWDEVKIEILANFKQD